MVVVVQQFRLRRIRDSSCMAVCAGEIRKRTQACGSWALILSSYLASFTLGASHATPDG